MIWSGRRSDEECTGLPDWALPGFYHVYAAALGSTPTDVQFEVTQAAPLGRHPDSDAASRAPRRARARVSPSSDDGFAEHDRLGQAVEVRRGQLREQLLIGGRRSCRLLLGSPGFETRRSAPRCARI